MAAAGAMGGGGGGIISAALELIKEKERQGDKAMDRLHDGMKSQMELTANQGSWTEGGKGPDKVVKEKVVEKEKTKEPEEEKPAESAAAPTTPAPAETPKEDDKPADISGMGIFDLAKGAGK